MKPVWLVLAEQLVTQAQRDLTRKRAKELRAKKIKHVIYGLDQRARLKEHRV